MSGTEEALELIQEIQKNLTVLDQIYSFLQTVKKKELVLLGKTRSTALILAGILENYYTCLETTFLRISEFFENALKPDRWHAELLRKMTLAIPGNREAVITDKTHSVLSELLRFRHFKKYYFEMDFDWDRLEYLLKKIEQANPMVRRELGSFIRFLEKIVN